MIRKIALTVLLIVLICLIFVFLHKWGQSVDAKHYGCDVLKEGDKLVCDPRY